VSKSSKVGLDVWYGDDIPQLARRRGLIGVLGEFEQDLWAYHPSRGGAVEYPSLLRIEGQIMPTKGSKGEVVTRELRCGARQQEFERRRRSQSCVRIRLFRRS
jgi:hypothetical protein